MIDFQKIPEPVYKDLVNLFGIEKAHEIIDSYDYNMYAISKIIAWESFIRLVRIRELLEWLKKISKRVKEIAFGAANKITEHRIIYSSLIIVSIIASIIYLLRII